MMPAQWDGAWQNSGGPPADANETFRQLAIGNKLIRDGDPLPDDLLQFAIDIVATCAKIADAYGDSEAGGNAGEHIRAELLF